MKEKLFNKPQPGQGTCCSRGGNVEGSEGINRQGILDRHWCESASNTPRKPANSQHDEEALHLFSPLTFIAFTFTCYAVGVDDLLSSLESLSINPHAHKQMATHALSEVEHAYGMPHKFLYHRLSEYDPVINPFSEMKDALAKGNVRFYQVLRNDHHGYAYYAVPEHIPQRAGDIKLLHFVKLHRDNRINPIGSMAINNESLQYWNRVISNPSFNPDELQRLGSGALRFSEYMHR